MKAQELDELAKGPQATPSFRGTFAFLSNFHPCIVVFENQYYRTAEHAYAAAKTFDKTARLQIAQTYRPGTAKRMGRNVEMRRDWENVKVKVMEEILLDKFRRNPQLADLLIATGESHLEERNTWNDKYWGTVDGEGKNQLGKLLMKVRAILIQDVVDKCTY